MIRDSIPGTRIAVVEGWVEDADPRFAGALQNDARRRYHAVDHTLDFQSVRTTITRFWRRSGVGGCMRSRVEAAAAPQRARLIVGEREEDPQWFSASFTST